VEEYGSYEDFYDECLLDEIDAIFEEELFRAAGASRAQLRQMAALREEERVATEALRKRLVAHRKVSRDRTKALRREAVRKDDGLRRLTEYTDLLDGGTRTRSLRCTSGTSTAGAGSSLAAAAAAPENDVDWFVG
jgi:hypothetical protein